MVGREFRLTDLPRLTELMAAGFPAENEVYGFRPQEIERLVRQMNRIPLRLLLGLLRLFGRALFRFLVVDDGGRVVATTLLTFEPRAGYVSMVMVDPASRRRGYAKQLLATARTLTAKRGKPYIALDVLSDNTPALALYAALGYQKVRSSHGLVRDAPFEPLVAGTPAIRPFAKSDLARLLEVGRANLPGPVAEVFPLAKDRIVGTGLAGRLFESASASWVVDRGHGAEAIATASTSAAASSATLAIPVLGPDVDAATAEALVRTALGWVADRKAPRVACIMPDDCGTARAALLAGGFRDALSLITLARPIR